MILSLVIILGLVFGSFLNVCVYRLPKHQPISKPRSRCPQCNHQLKFWENIPVLSYLLLRGKCSNCKIKISLRYPLIEILTTLVFVIIYYYFDISIETFLLMMFFSIVIIITFIDIDVQLIPNNLLITSSLPIIVFILINQSNSYLNHIKGAILLLSIFLLIGYIGKLIYKVDSMGMGDVKYAAVIGLLLGWEKGILAFVLAFFSAAAIIVIVSVYKKLSNKQRIPFGPFLSIGCFIAFFWGTEINNWYLGYYR
ncbi:MAG: prepilin peptidase [Candidatus Neomarinimicrobiota bacterium]